MGQPDTQQSTIFSRLKGLLEVTRHMRSGDDLPKLLEAIARTVADSLALRTVVVNLYRPQWNDFVVSTVHGGPEVREALLGEVRELADWGPILDERFLVRGAYLVPHGEFDWEQRLAYTPDLPVTDDPNAWHPEDALFVPLRNTEGALVGVLSVDEPVSGRRPRGDEIDTLVALTEHAALAVQAAREAASLKANRDALARLLEVSTHLNASTQPRELLTMVCAAISEALGFEKVAVQILDRDTATFETAADYGFKQNENVGEPLTADQVERLLRPEFEIEGCYHFTPAQAHALIPEREHGYRSQLNGRGPHAWQNDWLFVPLPDPRGGRIGYIWVDDPIDRLRPAPERLRILRAFANQAATALEQAAQRDALTTSAARTLAAIDSSPIAIIEVDLEGRVRAWNPAAVELFGWTAAETIGRMNPTIPPENLGQVRERIERIKGGEALRDLDLTRTRKDGTLVDLSVYAAGIRDAQGELTGIVATMVDLSARKRAEGALAASEARKDAILRASFEGVVVVDHDGLVVELNPAAEEILGWPAVEAVGQPFLDQVIAPEHRSELSRTLAEGGALLGTRLEVSALRADRRSFPAEIAIARVGISGQPLFAVSLSDVTARRAREERLREAEGKYRSLVEQLPLVTYVNESGLPLRTRYMSPQAELLLGYPAERWLEPDAGEWYLGLVHPDDRERLHAEIERTQLLSDGFRLDYRLQAADGRWVHVLDETVIVRDEEHRALFRHGYLLDLGAQWMGLTAGDAAAAFSIDGKSTGLD